MFWITPSHQKHRANSEDGEEEDNKQEALLIFFL